MATAECYEELNKWLKPHGLEVDKYSRYFCGMERAGTVTQSSVIMEALTKELP